MIENKNITSKIRMVIFYIIVIALGLICLFPLVNMLAVSFSSSTAVAANKVWFLPVDFTLAAYEEIINDKVFFTSFKNSVFRVVGVLLLNLPVTMLMAYPLSRPDHRFPARKYYMGMLIIAMLFYGGMIPNFLWMKTLGLLNSIWSLILPGVVVPFHIILMVNFFRGLPAAMEEAAIIDGANPLQILWHIFVPCSKPSVATVTLFVLVDNWNEFQSGLIYNTRAKYFPLMTYINSLNVNLEELMKHVGNTTSGAALAGLQVGERNLNAAKIVVAVVPLLIIYPLLQKYLIGGMVMGSVKE